MLSKFTFSSFIDIYLSNWITIEIFGFTQFIYISFLRLLCLNFLWKSEHLSEA